MQPLYLRKADNKTTTDISHSPHLVPTKVAKNPPLIERLLTNYRNDNGQWSGKRIPVGQWYLGHVNTCPHTTKVISLNPLRGRERERERVIWFAYEIHVARRWVGRTAHATQRIDLFTAHTTTEFRDNINLRGGFGHDSASSPRQSN